MAIQSTLNNEPQKITIGVLVNIHMDHVAKIVGVFRDANPHIMIEFVIDHDEPLQKLLKENKIDLAIVNSHTQADNFVPLIPEHMCIAVSKQHPIASKKSVTLNTLNQEKFIERVKCGFWHDVNKLFIQHNISSHTVMQAENDEFVLSLVAENLGVSIITDRVTPYQVSFIPISDFKIDQYIGIAIASTITAAHVQIFYDTIIRQYNPE